MNGMSLFERYFTRQSEIHLDSSIDLMSASAIFRVDRAGGFFVVDAGRIAIFRYDPYGRLARMWEMDDNEGQLRFTPIGVERLTDGRIVLVGLEGGVMLFDTELNSPHVVGPTNLKRIDSVMALTDGGFLVAGRSGEVPHPNLLHVFDSKAVQQRSFFPRPEVSPDEEGIVHIAGYASFDKQGDSIVANFSFRNVLHKYSIRGMWVDSVIITSVRPPSIAQPMKLDAGRVFHALQGVGLIRDIYWLCNGNYLIQTGRMQNFQQEYDLILVDRRGRQVFYLSNTPQLVAIDRESNSFYFAEREVIEGSMLLRTKMRPPFALSGCTL